MTNQLLNIDLHDLGALVRTHREHLEQTQDQLAKRVNISKQMLALLEQGRSLPNAPELQRICEAVGVPQLYWEPYTQPEGLRRIKFEMVLAEVTGSSASLAGSPREVTEPADKLLAQLFEAGLSAQQAHARFNQLLVFYGIPQCPRTLFERFFAGDTFASIEKFKRASTDYQQVAIRLFCSFREAWFTLTNTPDVEAYLQPLKPRSIESFKERLDWNVIEQIPNAHLPDLGYIAAARARKVNQERQVVSSFLAELAKGLKKEGKAALDKHSESKKRKMDSLLRKLGTTFDHTLFSPLFPIDPDRLEREAKLLAPLDEKDIARMAETQAIALNNLTHYLASDYLDVYVATSMRNDADFVSVNEFVGKLFRRDELKVLKLRYFNPTQSWIEDRVAKGLVEALMLKRAQYTIYMAQKEDTFGKDSEASVSLGQGKPVIVYVPKLVVEMAGIDTELLWQMKREDLINTLVREGTADDKDYDESVDKEALASRLLTVRLETLSADNLADAARKCWADFDLYGEEQRILADTRAEGEKRRDAYRKWLDSVVKGPSALNPSAETVRDFIQILVSIAARFERRAQVFREIHPLALQVILSTGVLNGILVCRSVETCALILRGLIENNLEYHPDNDDVNYRLIEKISGSTVRVISRNQMISNSFMTHYRRE